MGLAGFHPLIQAWFSGRFVSPTEAQRAGWPLIQSGRDALIVAPTGSGKTLAAFLACLDRLVREALDGRPAETVRVLYISPLKALSNDIHRNLIGPLAEIQDRAAAEGLLLPTIRVAVRTGDTTPAERRAMIRRPPQILVTTPESAYLLLTSRSGRDLLRDVETVIVDEIHAVARDKRGSHLSLSLARLDALCGRRPVRIGLSATQKPVDEVARFLVGGDAPEPAIVDSGHLRDLDLAIETPSGPLTTVCSNEQWKTVYERIAALIQSHRTTLVFVNTRRLAERVTHQLTQLLGDDRVTAHHGSLSKKLRMRAEARLKAGEISAVVATASLEMGIDIGSVDLVVQIGSPRSIATFLQRIGRSGHALGAKPKGRIFALTIDELLECAALVSAARAGDLDKIEIPEKPLDILAQQIVAELACGEWPEKALYDLVRKAYPYRDLGRDEFDRIVEMLADGISTGMGRIGAYLHRDRVGGRIRARRGAALTAVTSGGAIPELADYKVVLEPEGTVVGSVDEDFAIESLAGDIFLLGNNSWRVLQVRTAEMAVADANGASPTIPFWRGEAPARTIELSAALSRLRRQIGDRVSDPAAAAVWLSAQCAVAPDTAREAVDYVAAQIAATGFVPTQETILVERFFDDSGGTQLVIHAPYGGRINRALGLALRKRFCRRFDFELQALADDNGVVLSLGTQQGVIVEEVFEMIRSEQAASVLSQAVLAAPMFKTRWRWNLTRSLMVLRQRGGKRVPPFLQRLRADDLMVAVFPALTACPENGTIVGEIEIPDHPLVRQTLHDTLHEAADLDGFEAMLRKIEDGSVRVIALESREPSPFAYNLLNANPYAFLDDAPLEERRTRAVSTRPTMDPGVMDELKEADPEAVEEVSREAWPLVRDGDELHDALLLVGLFPEAEGAAWEKMFTELLTAGRGITARDSTGRRFWIPVERWPLVEAAVLGLIVDARPTVPEGVRRDWNEAESVEAILKGWIEILGPTTVAALSQRTGIGPSRFDRALIALETGGVVARGRFRAGESHGEEWCSRRLAARIFRRTIERRRRQVASVSADRYLDFLLGWCHRAPQARARGRGGLRDVIHQLQGFEIPAALWERDILPGRIADYDPAWLEEMSRAGELVWGRVRSTAVRDANRLIPICFMLREDLGWLLNRSEPVTLDDEAGRVLDALVRRGASFERELGAATGLTEDRLQSALWRLVAAGRVSADGLGAVRRLTMGRRIKEARRRYHPLWPAKSMPPAGRWWRLTLDGPSDPSKMSEEMDPVFRWARLLLDRYGVIFRDLLAREDAAPAWRVLTPVYRRLEARGVVRGGRFVTGVGGEQYALPGAVERLRRSAEESPQSEPVVVSAADPTNLVGIITPGPKIPAQAANRVAYLAGRCIGHRIGKTTWIDPSLPSDLAPRVERLLRLPTSRSESVGQTSPSL